MLSNSNIFDNLLMVLCIMYFVFAASFDWSLVCIFIFFRTTTKLTGDHFVFNHFIIVVWLLIQLLLMECRTFLSMCFLLYGNDQDLLLIIRTNYFRLHNFKCYSALLMIAQVRRSNCEFLVINSYIYSSLNHYYFLQK